MDTITDYTLRQVAAAIEDSGLTHVHTIKIELNGQHGGADLTIKGFDTDESMDVSLYNEKRIKVVLT